MLSVINALVGLTRTATTFAVGISSRNSSSRFGASSVFILVTPVMLPPGRVKSRDKSSRYRVGTRLEYDGNCCSRRLCRDCIMTQNAMEQGSRGELGRPPDVRFGSKADMCSASGHVR